MTGRFINGGAGGGGKRRAFTLVELMVAMSVLTLIVLVLFKIFDKTQSALRSNVAQVDVMEGGRALMDLLKRDLEQITAPEGLDTNNVNFYVGLGGPVHVLDLPGSESWTARTNYLDEVYFLKSNRDSGMNLVWDATVYRVLSRSNMTPDRLDNPLYATNFAVEGVGWLARRAVPATVVDMTNVLATTPRLDTPLSWSQHPFNLATGRDVADWVRFSRVAGGVVHFRVTPLDSRGQPLFYSLATNLSAYGSAVAVQLPNQGAVDPSRWRYFLVGDALPASLQVELGILEPQVAGRLSSLPNPQVRAAYLREQAAKIHYFQQRIPLRSAPRLLPKP